jgi:hypothetical protein
MRLIILPLVAVVLFIIGISISSAQWHVWDGSLLPSEADTAWHHEQEADYAVRFSTIIDDPDIPGNKLLRFEEPTGPDQETWRVNWQADPDIGATLVFRAKALAAGSFDRDFDVYIYNGSYRERLVSNGGTELKFDKSKAFVAFETGDWHIYRLTIIGDLITLYVDEDSFDLMYAMGEANENNLFRFGDLGSSTIGTLYDWVIYDVSGAYAPGEGTPLPDTLTGNPAAIDQVSLIRPDNFNLAQNYPNPFNPSTNIQFSVVKSGLVSLKIYDINGRIVRHLVNQSKQAGTYNVSWDGLDQYGNQLSSGIYYYLLEAGNYKDAKKMTLLK